MPCHSGGMIKILREGNSSQVVHYFIEEDQSSICPSVIKRSPPWGVEHAAHTGISGIVAVYPAHGPSLGHLNLISVGLSERAPYSGCIFDLGTDQGLISCCANC